MKYIKLNFSISLIILLFGTLCSCKKECNDCDPCPTCYGDTISPYNWEKVLSTGWEVNDVFILNQNIYAGCYQGIDITKGAQGIFLSTDQGKSWAEFNTGMPHADHPLFYPCITTFGAKGTETIFAGTVEGMYLSTSGSVWHYSNGGLPDSSYIHSIYGGSQPYAVCGDQNGGSLYHQYYSSANWTYSPCPYHDLKLVTTRGYKIYVSSGSKIYFTEYLGGSWQDISISPDFTNPPLSFLYSAGEYVFFGAASEHENGLYRIGDDLSWVCLSNGFSNKNTYSMSSYGDNLFVSTGEGIKKSIDHGQTWSSLGAIDDPQSAGSILPAYSIAADEEFLYAGASHGVYKRKY